MKYLTEKDIYLLTKKEGKVLTEGGKVELGFIWTLLTTVATTALPYIFQMGTRISPPSVESPPSVIRPVGVSAEAYNALAEEVQRVQNIVAQQMALEEEAKKLAREREATEKRKETLIKYSPFILLAVAGVGFMILRRRR